MRIGRIKNFRSKCKSYSEDEIDRINKSAICIHCKERRIILHCITNNQTEMRVCVNIKCFLYNNIDNLKSWIQ